MLYNEFIINLMKVIEIVNLNKNKNYKASKLFKELYNLLYIESNCEKYLKNINNLNENEIEVFNKFAKLNSLSRKKIIKDYEENYNNLNINKNKFLNKYENINDYIAAIILNEVGNNIINKDIINEFNKEYNCNYSLLLLDNPFFIWLQGDLYNKRKLYNKSFNLGLNLKKTFYEYKLLSDIYNKDGANFLVNYLEINESFKHYYTVINIKNDLTNNSIREKDIQSKIKYYSNEYNNSDYDFMNYFLDAKKNNIKEEFVKKIICRNGLYEKYRKEQSLNFELSFLMYSLLNPEINNKINENDFYKNFDMIMNKMFECNCNVKNLILIIYNNEELKYVGTINKLEQIIADFMKKEDTKTKNFDKNKKL